MGVLQKRILMFFHIQRALSEFFDKNLFERIIIYLFLTMFISKLLFELIMGQWYFAQSQNQQWLFFSLLTLDYVVSFKKVLNIRVTLNPLSLFALLFFVMVAQGLFVGIIHHNPPFKIFNDTVPLLLIALNILRMQSHYELKKPINFKFLLHTTTWFAFFTCVFGEIANMLGKPSVATIAVGQVYFPIFFAALFMVKPFPKLIGAMFVTILAISITEINRTSMLFMILMVFTYALLQILKSPSRGSLFILTAVIVCSSLWMTLPKGSKTYNRIVGVTEIDLSSRKGAVGERQAEQDAVAAKLDLGGKTMQWVGLGFGGTYRVHFTHKYLKNYGHAHYSWVWFNLRFGYMGYFYLAILASMLIYNAIRSLSMKTENSVFVALLCVSGLIYLMTYVNALFLSSGIHFLYLREEDDDEHLE